MRLQCPRCGSAREAHEDVAMRCACGERLEPSAPRDEAALPHERPDGPDPGLARRRRLREGFLERYAASLALLIPMVTLGGACCSPSIGVALFVAGLTLGGALYSLSPRATVHAKKVYWILAGALILLTLAVAGLMNMGRLSFVP